jgi:multidrug resistance efflux pump
MPTDTETEKPAEPQKPAAEKPAAPEPPPQPLDPAKKRRNWLIGGAVALLLVIGVFVWWWESRKYESTDDAQIDGHLNPIASRVAGTIVAVHVEDNVYVEAGAPLVDLDPRDYAASDPDQSRQYSGANRTSTTVMSRRRCPDSSRNAVPNWVRAFPPVSN